MPETTAASAAAEVAAAAIAPPSASCVQSPASAAAVATTVAAAVTATAIPADSGSAAQTPQAPALDFAGKTLLVAGGSGFVGAAVVHAALEAGFSEVTSLGRSAAAMTTANSHGTPTPLCRHIILNLADATATADALRGCSYDFVINLAGKIDQSDTPGIWSRQLEVNLTATLHLAEACQRGAVGRFIQVGSGMEYGGAPCPAAPDGPELPASAYGVSKLAASRLVLAKARTEGFPGVVARPFSIYGTGQPDASFLAAALAAARSGREFPTTPGGQTRDFVPVEKVAAELLELCALPTMDVVGRAFNLCTGVELSLRRVLEIFREIYPAFTPRFGALPYRPTEQMRSAGTPFRPWPLSQTEAALRHFALPH